MMEKRKFENIGVETSLLGFGCMRFPEKDGEIDETAAQALIDRAYENGVRYFDTAYPYHGGKSEPFTGKALSKYERSSYMLATKLPIWEKEKIADTEKFVDHQLERLGVDYVDFYLLHAVDEAKWDVILELGIIEQLEKIKEKGKIKHFGLSFHDEYEAFEKIITYRKWDFVQLQINYIDIREQAGLKGLELCEKLGIPVIVMEPIKGGTLANLPDDVAEIFKSYEPESSLSSWAMRWCASFDNVKLILSGMSEMYQVEDNLKTFCNYKPLNEEEMALVARAAEKILSKMKNGCTDCRYCQPCPFGVNIPKCFDIWNKYSAFGNTEQAKKRWAETDDAEKPMNCTKCGKCEKKCPQKIQIREDLERLAKEMDALI